LKQLANSNRQPIPATLSGEQKKILADLNSLSGDDFDRSYVDLIKKNHDTTVALFDNAAREATLNADFRVFANQTLPLLREHQKHSHALASNSETSLTQTKKPIPKQ
jgi:putative membrane protein